MHDSAEPGCRAILFFIDQQLAQIWLFVGQQVSLMGTWGYIKLTVMLSKVVYYSKLNSCGYDRTIRTVLQTIIVKH